MPGIQLAHAGRKASICFTLERRKSFRPSEGGWTTLAPSPIPFRDTDPVPQEMSLSEIAQTKKDFITAAGRSFDAGFEVIEIHAAHGYLLNSFQSPLSNSRTDEYGGSFENRIRLVKEIASGIRTVWPEKFPLFLRISATDYAEGGWGLPDSVELVKDVKKLGVDLIDVSSGGLIAKVQVPLGPGYQVPFSETIRSKTGILTAAVGLITKSAQAEEIISSGKADLVMIARESLRNPNFPLSAAKELGVEIDYWPSQYLRAK